MDAAEFALRGLLALVGLGYVLHYHLMANAARQTPMLLKLVVYPIITAAGAGAIICALTTTQWHLIAGLVLSLIGGAGALIVALAVWRAGQHVCDVMDHAAWVRAYSAMQAALGPVRQHVEAAREYLPPDAPEEIWVMGDSRKGGLGNDR